MSKANSVDYLSIAGEQTRTQSVEVYGGGVAVAARSLLN
jgi:hypothetical protein